MNAVGDIISPPLACLTLLKGAFHTTIQRGSSLRKPVEEAPVRQIIKKVTIEASLFPFPLHIYSASF